MGGFGGGQKGGMGKGPPGAPGDPCKFFQRTGWCQYGDECRFAHVPSADTPVGVPQGGQKSGEPCQFFVKAGWCKYGEQCRHEHIPGPDTPLGVTAPGANGEICKFFQKAGYCQYGDQCRYAHVPGPDTPTGATGCGGKGGQPSEPCKFFANNGWCQYGDQCRFAHGGGGFDGGKGFGSGRSFGGGKDFGGGGAAAVTASEAPLSQGEYEAAAAALINTPGMKKAEAVGLQLTDDAVQALLKIPAMNASELLEAVAEKHATLRDPSNYVVSTIARGYVPRSAGGHGMW
ncbi:unnamed protein product [Polarella glacialis]|nr:unnamed protein product [Polarella glacialis]